MAEEKRNMGSSGFEEKEEQENYLAGEGKGYPVSPSGR